MSCLHLYLRKKSQRIIGPITWRIFVISGAVFSSAEQAGAVYVMAQRIAQSLQMGIAFHKETLGEKDHAFKDFAIRRSK